MPLWAANVIATENAKRSDVTADWWIPDARYASKREIEGYASATSVNRGGSINLYVQASSADPFYSIHVYRVGWYGGVGGREMAGPIWRFRSVQPACAMTDVQARLVECAWTNPYTLNIPGNSDPTDWASGVYLAKLTGGLTGKQSYIVFVVRDDARRALVNFQSSVTTYAAYNNWGGYDFYDTDSIGGTPAYKLSFNRPYSNGQRHLNGKGAGDFLAWEINMLRFVEREGYDVKYSTNIDTHRTPLKLTDLRLFLSVGHDEYYTKEMYDALQSARDAGISLGFFGANNIYWQVRLERSIATGRSNRTVVAYKYATDPIIATNPQRATTLWRDQAVVPMNRPEASLIGVMYDYNTVYGDMVMADCGDWLCTGTSLKPGDVLPGMLGYEVDRVAPSSPPGTRVLASSPYEVCLDYPTCSRFERRFSQATHYAAPSGAEVFATGSMQWNWGLDSFSPGLPAGRVDQHIDLANPAVQQLTRNVLNRFTAGGFFEPPNIISTAVTSAGVSSLYRYTVRATDPNSADVLSYSLTQAPNGMVISASNGLIRWTPTSRAWSVPVTVRVTDPKGLFDEQSFTIHVD
ncbi:putative Ig domain-containing protein [Burkholderiales bacterium JOSHI_001]|nr:putative Ig domain-containing protein [Burkholderiales bacterium JOSHI_001]